MLAINQPQIPDFTDPLGLLVRCHERIQGQLETLARAAEVLRAADAKSVPGAFAAIDAACKHFAVAGVKHTEDEEVSLFPRLRKHGRAGGDEALAAMAELESQHRTAEQMHKQFDGFVLTLPRDGSADIRELDCFSEMAAELDEFYRPHIFMEDNLVFPIAARVLPAEEIAALGEEMRSRRQDIFKSLHFLD
jgi:hemerythrin-like domain-containing protein